MNENTSANNEMPERPLQVVTACRLRDLPVLQIAADQLREQVPLKSLQVIAPGRDCAKIAAGLGGQATVIPEDDFIPGMSPAEIRQLPLPRFPRTAGWYFQQLLKLQFAFQQPADDFYLIWDADTVPLRPLRFFDRDGRMLLTTATEFHPPYFETYQRLLGEHPQPECSLIAQHMVVQKSVAREMLARIESSAGAGKNWAWKIMRNLPASGNNLNLFSEYETYGHYVRRQYPDRVRLVERRWLRAGTTFTRGWIPSPKQLQALGEQYDYVSFERASQNWWQFGKMWLKRYVQPG